LVRTIRRDWRILKYDSPRKRNSQRGYNRQRQARGSGSAFQVMLTSLDGPERQRAATQLAIRPDTGSVVSGHCGGSCSDAAPLVTRASRVSTLQRCNVRLKSLSTPVRFADLQGLSQSVRHIAKPLPSNADALSICRHRTRFTSTLPFRFEGQKRIYVAFPAILAYSQTSGIRRG
jgi:hypothetical protein